MLSGLHGQSRIHYLPHPGNAGDAVVNVGFFDLAKSLGLRYEVITRRTKLDRDDTLIMAGGGGLLVGEAAPAGLIDRYSKSVARLVILPQTVTGNEDLLRDLTSNVTIFLREQTSFDHVRRYAKSGVVLLDHDMAFHADIEQLIKRRGLRGLRPSPRKLGRLAQLAQLRRRARSNRHLDAFRTDREATGRHPAKAEMDISKLATFGVRTRDASYFSAAQLAKTINAFDSIATDRLHVAIVSTLLRKRTVLYDNSYWKCRAVYEHSLKSYDNIEMAAARVSPD
jgi:exopolysaccharide biosynthesis predicted pyruvyltransferase EpsI